MIFPNLMVSVDGNEAISFVEFCAINEFDADEITAMRYELECEGRTSYGGGAAPEIIIQAVEG